MIQYGSFRSRPGWGWLRNTRNLAGLLNPLGITRRQFWNAGRRRWWYVLEGGRLADLQARYTGTVDVPEAG